MKKDSVLNPFADRLAAFVARLRRRHLTVAIVCGEAKFTDCVFVQRKLEAKGEMHAEESHAIMESIWGENK